MKALRKYWKRFATKVLVRLKQLQGTPYEIAAGFACGVAVSFTPFLGFHLILAAITAWLIRGNIVSSALGTLLGNPWTFPFIWITVLATGRFFLGYDAVNTHVNFLHIFESATSALFTFNFTNFGRDVWPIFFPMMIGCIPYYLLSWFFSYKLIKSLMEKLAQKHLARLTRKDHTK